MEIDRLLTQVFLEIHPEDAARIVERLSPEEVAALLEETPPPIAATVLKRVSPLSAAECLACIAAEQAGLIIAALPLDIAAGLLRRTGSHARDRLLASIPADVLAYLRRLLQYPEGTAGAFMDPQVLTLPSDIAVSDALTQVRRAPQHVFYYFYIIDRAHRLVGVLNLRELMLAPPSEVLATVMHPHVTRLLAHADRMTVITHFGWRRFHALPVVDDTSVFVGAIRYETLRRLEGESAAGGQEQPALAAVRTLGTLYSIGFSYLLKGLASVIAPQHVGGETGLGGRP